MTNSIDEFESMFRAAEREPFVSSDIPINRVLFIGNPDTQLQQVQSCFSRLAEPTEWTILPEADFSNVDDLLSRLASQSPDLVVTHRHLKDHAATSRHSLGAYLDALTQATSVPVLLLPGTAAEPASLTDQICNEVMVVTDHISGDNLLVNYGTRLAPEEGTVFLCNIEDDAVYERYMQAIARIPEIDTEEARTLIISQLLKESADFIESCIDELSAQHPRMKFESIVDRGHHLTQYKQLIQSNAVDLVIAHTKDDDQLAMHGLAYALAVELRDTSFLLL